MRRGGINASTKIGDNQGQMAPIDDRDGVAVNPWKSSSQPVQTKAYRHRLARLI